MVYHHSLQSRIVKTFFIFGSLLSLFYAVFIFIGFDFMEDYLESNLYQKIIQTELDSFLKQYKQNENIRPPRSPYLSIYLDFSSMPEALKKMVAGRSDGYYENDNIQNSEGNEYNFLIRTISDTRKTVYLFYDTQFLEISGNHMRAILFILAAGYLLVIFISIWIGRATSRKVIEPVAHLAEIIKKTDPDHLPTDLSASFFQDEVGTLAQAMEHAMMRIRLFIEREQQFTRNASHELRTPVTVIKGAAELLRHNPGFGNPGIQGPVLRIDRSVADMEDIIDSFLWLAREKNDLKNSEEYNVAELLNDAIDQHQYLLQNKSIDIELDNETDLRIKVPRSLLAIVLNNLIKNAFNYTTSGKIRISVTADRIVFKDTGIGIPSDLLDKATEPNMRGKGSRGLGIGLAIVKMICERLDWRLEIQSHPGSGTTVQLIF